MLLLTHSPLANALTLANTGDSKILCCSPLDSLSHFVYSWRLAWKTPSRRASLGSHWRWRNSRLCAWSWAGVCSASERKMLRSLVRSWTGHFQGKWISTQAGNAQLTLNKDWSLLRLGRGDVFCLRLRLGSIIWVDQDRLRLRQHPRRHHNFLWCRSG